MIPFEFKYYKPETLDEAIKLYSKLRSHGKKPIYYGGGTEFISMARMHNVYSDAVIDIKGIPQCNILELNEQELVMGSALTLTRLAQSNYFPLLNLAVKRIADHTIQGKITLGGNLAGTIIYKEAALPLMVSNSKILAVSDKGERWIDARKMFDSSHKLQEGELITQVVTNQAFLELPYEHVKRTKNEKIDYPLITIVSLKADDGINIALSGLYENPFCFNVDEKVLKNDTQPMEETINSIVDDLPSEMLNDLGGSKEYRKFMLSSMLLELLEKLREVA